MEETKNGLSCVEVPSSDSHGTGGSYFGNGLLLDVSKYVKNNFASIGGQGAKARQWNTQGGDGGIAGQGGIINVSKNSIVEAFNGNKFTDGTDYKDGENQLEIYAQNGELRDVYRYSMHFENKKYIYKDKEYEYKELYKMIFGDTVSEDIDNFVEKNENPVDNYLVRPATTCDLSGYTNPITSNTQGVGSGAGYIELDNGTYTIDSNLN